MSTPPNADDPRDEADDEQSRISALIDSLLKLPTSQQADAIEEIVRASEAVADQPTLAKVYREPASSLLRTEGGSNLHHVLQLLGASVKNAPSTYGRGAASGLAYPTEGGRYLLITDDEFKSAIEAVERAEFLSSVVAIEYKFPLSKYLSNIGRSLIHFYRAGIGKDFLQSLASQSIFTLPDQPPRIWKRRGRGRPKPGSEEELFAFIREVYGDYLIAGFGEKLRPYLYKKDRALYEAIRAYERGGGGRELPDDITMPSRSQIVHGRILTAAEFGLDSLTAPKRRSVVGKTRRAERPADLKP